MTKNFQPPQGIAGLLYGLNFKTQDWINPISKEEYHKNDHKDWEIPQIEIIKYMPYDLQMFLQESYNFIMEFEFDTETKGHGYLYAVEYER